ncbi:hypothetical protein L484_005487 [Morus notabilis]|uniref:Uncharacterized protein n=1 Tax=Morus notabilis TaxID=981085 RepID=W9QC43_9ROSA|nr:hypothetical protein L484_005487 [Morus notabilis]
MVRVCSSEFQALVIRRLGKSSFKARNGTETEPRVPASAAVHPNGQFGGAKSKTPLRIATFNAALFSMALAVPKATSFVKDANDNVLKVRNLNMQAKSLNDRPNTILKQSPLHPNLMSSNNNNNNLDNLSNQQKFERSKLRVSINLPDNEISMMWNRQLSFFEDGKVGSSSISRFLS